tara:strand:- start:126 stop:287 length:162 start_codon:yes stop_codon:yes gene_type:complete
MKKKHKEFLNELRDSGVTNMYGASPYLSAAFGIPTKKAREILGEWIRSFTPVN